MYVKMIVLVLVMILAVASADTIVGGYVDADINDPDVKNALKYAVAHYNKNSNDVYVYRVSEVIKTQQQVVSGTNYMFNVKLARTNCKKGGVKTNCYVPKNSKTSRCKIVVWTQSWTNSIKVTSNSCLKTV